MIPLSKKGIVRVAKKLIMDGRLDSVFAREAEKNNCPPMEIKRLVLSLSDSDMINIIEKHLGSLGGIFEWKK